MENTVTLIKTISLNKKHEKTKENRRKEMRDVPAKAKPSLPPPIWVEPACGGQLTERTRGRSHLHRISHFLSPPFSENNEPTPQSVLSETKFLNSIFSRGFQAQNRVFSDSSFCLVFYAHFSILQNVIHE